MEVPVHPRRQAALQRGQALAVRHDRVVLPVRLRRRGAREGRGREGAASMKTSLARFLLWVIPKTTGRLERWAEDTRRAARTRAMLARFPIGARVRLFCPASCADKHAGPWI